MMIPLLLLFLGLQPSQSQQELHRQQQIVRELEHRVRRQQEEIERIAAMVEQRNQRDPVCTAEVRAVNGLKFTVPAEVTAAVGLNLFSTVSKPEGDCLSAEVRVTASYLDAAGNLICSGAIENAATQSALAQSINLEIRPLDLGQFVRWVNEPPRTNSGPKRLMCIDPEGIAEVTALDSVRAIIVRATVLPRRGGMSTAEILLELDASNAGV